MVLLFCDPKPANNSIHFFLLHKQFAITAKRFISLSFIFLLCLLIYSVKLDGCVLERTERMSLNNPLLSRHSSFLKAD